jgi:hypothetical protein
VPLEDGLARTVAYFEARLRTNLPAA